MEEVADTGRTVLFVSHNMSMVQSLCDRAFLLEAGQLVREGSAREVVQSYLQVVESTLTVPLEERTDREGNGNVRMVSLKIEGADPEQGIHVGARLRVTIGYRSSRPVRHPRFLVPVYDVTRTPICLLDSDAGGLPDELPAEGEVVCETEPLMVSPGRCYVDVKLRQGTELIDYVGNAGAFDVEEHDVPQVGEVPTRKWAMYVVSQSWSGDGGGPVAVASEPAWTANGYR
jgi:lipopolysaccharide transport system ATP-binding protein